MELFWAQILVEVWDQEFRLEASPFLEIVLFIVGEPIIKENVVFAVTMVAWYLQIALVLYFQWYFNI